MIFPENSENSVYNYRKDRTDRSVEESIKEINF